MRVRNANESVAKKYSWEVVGEATANPTRNRGTVSVRVTADLLGQDNLLGTDEWRCLPTNERVGSPCIEIDRQQHSDSCCPMSQIQAIPAGGRPVVRCTTFPHYSSDADAIAARRGRDGHNSSTTRMTRCRPSAQRARLLEPVTTATHSARIVVSRIDFSQIRNTPVTRIRRTYRNGRILTSEYLMSDHGFFDCRCNHEQATGWIPSFARHHLAESGPFNCHREFPHATSV
jgi:hypothetical protein